MARQTRISLTFRWTRNGPCECEYKTLCDSAANPDPAELDDRLAINLEELHVHQVYYFKLRVTKFSRDQSIYSKVYVENFLEK